MLPIAMTPDERKMLNTAEATIKVGLRSFLAVGEALATIRDNRLYRDEFATFEDYCQTKWNFTGRRSRQLIDAHDVVAGLPTGTMVPVNERQARALVGLTPTQAAQVMEATAEKGKVTEAAIRETRRASVLPDGRPSSYAMEGLAKAVPEVRRTKRRALPDSYRDAVYSVQRAVERLARLHVDDRFPAYRKGISEVHHSDLFRAVTWLDEMESDIAGHLLCRKCSSRRTPRWDNDEQLCDACRAEASGR
jgi:hypothetical protein